MFINWEYLYYQIYLFFIAPWWGENVAAGWIALRVLALLASVVLAALVAYLIFQILRLRREEKVELERLLHETPAAPPEGSMEWQRVLGHMSSDNPAEWKVGIIEADNILDALVKAMNYPGETLGERLQKIEPSDFRTLDQAWSAHKVRNRVAHQPGYQLTEREAREAIENYRIVFEEFHCL